MLSLYRARLRSSKSMAIACQRNCWLKGGRLLAAHFSTSSRCEAKSYKLVVLGGGTGGASMANKFSRKFGKGYVAVVEPAETHYYQPMLTLVGAGTKTLADMSSPMSSVLSSRNDRIVDRVAAIDPDACLVTTEKGEELKYEYLIVAIGLQLRFDMIKGLLEAFESDPRVVSNYWPKIVHKTFPAIQSFKGGNAIFSFPNTPIKCAGAPQKIMYLMEHYLQKTGCRDKANIVYNTSLPVIFGVKKYAAVLREIASSRNITVNYRTNLVEVRPETSESVFRNLDTDEETVMKYDFLHVGAPCSTAEVLRTHKTLVNAAGYLDVDKGTLQHVKYPNIFGIGDCTSAPTSKTAAAAASQTGIVAQNLLAVMEGKTLPAQYDGYTSCPLLTKYKKCVLAEFDYDGNPLETLPFDQGKERTSMWYLKVSAMPRFYWHLLLPGLWEGPANIRKLLHLGRK